jgi:predicted NAD/FAD-dependent oxidoreductase
MTGRSSLAGGSSPAVPRGSAGVVVIGGGLAGISAAIELAGAGLPVTLVEERPWLGGATCSFARRGLIIDNGQHAFLKCCTAYRELLARLGVASSCSIQDELDLTVLSAREADAVGSGTGQFAGGPGVAGVPGGDRQAVGEVRQAVLRRSELRPPLHLAGALAQYDLLSPAERLLAGAAWVTLQFAGRTNRGDGVRLGRSLRWRAQSEHARRMFWDLLTVPALNVAGDEGGLGAAARALRAATLGSPDGADIGVPAVPLSMLHGGPATDVLAGAGVQVRLGSKAVAVRTTSDGGYHVQLADRPRSEDTQFEYGAPEVIRADGVVLAVPSFDAAALAPVELAGAADGWARLQPSPIVSIHVVYGREVTSLPFAAVAGAPARWVIDKTRAAGLHAGQYLAVSVPAADAYVDRPASALRQEFLPLLARLFPAAAGATVEDFFVTRERRATIRQVPGTERLRARQPVSLPGLAVAGAWTATGWPASMEGAVRSGHTAATKLLSELAGLPAARAPMVTAAQGRPAVPAPRGDGQPADTADWPAPARH